MPFLMTVTEQRENPAAAVQRYTQVVDALDLDAVIRAVNTPPPPPKRSHRRRGEEGASNG